mgnify:FL=1
MHPDIVTVLTKIKTICNALKFLVSKSVVPEVQIYFKNLSTVQLAKLLRSDDPSSSTVLEEKEEESATATATATTTTSTAHDPRSTTSTTNNHVISLTISAVSGVFGVSNTSGHENKLPPALRNFVPLNKRPELKTVIDECNHTEALFRENPSKESLQHKLNNTTKELQHKYLNVIEAESKERDEDQATWLYDKGQVVAAGASHFEGVYDSVYQTITGSEADSLSQFHQTMNKFPWNRKSSNACQKQHTVMEVMRAALSTKKEFFDPFLHQMHGDLVMTDKIAADFPTTANLKGARRMVEKIALQPKGTLDPSRILDAARAMIVATDINAIVMVLKYLHTKRGTIFIKRVKNRFLSPSLGGWRDVMVNFSFRADPTQHICELQIVHKSMLTARKGLPGHEVYNRVRNAWELMEHAGVDMTRWWHESLGFSHHCLLLGSAVRNIDGQWSHDVSWNGGLIRGIKYLQRNDRCHGQQSHLSVFVSIVEFPNSWPEDMALSSVELPGKSIQGTGSISHRRRVA